MFSKTRIRNIKFVQQLMQNKFADQEYVCVCMRERKNWGLRQLLRGIKYMTHSFKMTKNIVLFFNVMKCE